MQRHSTASEHEHARACCNVTTVFSRMSTPFIRVHRTAHACPSRGGAYESYTTKQPGFYSTVIGLYNILERMQWKLYLPSYLIHTQLVSIGLHCLSML